MLDLEEHTFKLLSEKWERGVNEMRDTEFLTYRGRCACGVRFAGFSVDSVTAVFDAHVMESNTAMAPRISPTTRPYRPRNESE